MESPKRLVYWQIPEELFQQMLVLAWHTGKKLMVEGAMSDGLTAEEKEAELADISARIKRILNGSSTGEDQAILGAFLGALEGRPELQTNRQLCAIIKMFSGALEICFPKQD